jgi:hypothetical protein
VPASIPTNVNGVTTLVPRSRSDRPGWSRCTTGVRRLGPRRARRRGSGAGGSPTWSASQRPHRAAGWRSPRRSWRWACSPRSAATTSASAATPRPGLRRQDEDAGGAGSQAAGLHGEVRGRAVQREEGERTWFSGRTRHPAPDRVGGTV